MKGFETYDAKVLVAWGEAISGNEKIRQWLLQNGYPELGVFCFAIRNQEEARNWLVKNKFPHLMAMINAIEGNEDAIAWLKKFDFKVMLHMALAADGIDRSRAWLKRYHLIFSLLSQRMEKVKDEIDWNNNDPHKINP